MTTIPKDLVESTWRDFASLAPREAQRMAERVGRHQTALLSYVMAETEDYPSAHELGVYLFFVIVRMFEGLPGHRLKRVSNQLIERRYAQNQVMMEGLLNAHDGFLERAAHVRLDSQPHVFSYLTEAILSDDDSDLELTEEEEGLLFLIFKTVVDLLETACKKRRL